MFFLGGQSELVRQVAYMYIDDDLPMWTGLEQWSVGESFSGLKTLCTICSLCILHSSQHCARTTLSLCSSGNGDGWYVAFLHGSSVADGWGRSLLILDCTCYQGPKVKKNTILPSISRSKFDVYALPIYTAVNLQIPNVHAAVILKFQVLACHQSQRRTRTRTCEWEGQKCGSQHWLRFLNLYIFHVFIDREHRTSYTARVVLLVD